MSKKLGVKARLYSIVWQYDAEHGSYRQRHRILALNAEDAIKQTKPIDLYKAVLIRVETLAEELEILATHDLFKAIYGDGRLPYHDKEVRELFQSVEVD